MNNSWTYNLDWLETTPVSRDELPQMLSIILYNSYSCKAVVESFDPGTGDYELILQGTLDRNWSSNTQRYSLDLR